MTDPTPPDDEPAAVDLKVAGVDGWYLILRKIREEKARLEIVEQQARDAIEKALGDAVDGVIDGRPVVRWHHTAAPRRFDKKALAKDHPDLIEKYTVVGKPGRRFELVDPKDGAQ